jgi:ABC-type antimicrobial peptide transport system permease subunit
VIEQLPSEVFIRWIILLSRVLPTYRRTARQVKARGSIASKTRMAITLVASALYGVRPSDPVSFSATLLAVCAFAAAASCLPIWRTLRIDPATILRDE